MARKPAKAASREPASTPAAPSGSDSLPDVLWACYKRRGRGHPPLYFEVPAGTPNYRSHEIAGTGLKCSYDISCHPVKIRPEGLKESHRVRWPNAVTGSWCKEIIFFWIPPKI